MASFVRCGIVAVSLAIVLFSTSCEKHPLGQMPEVQCEQPDPAKAWSHSDKADANLSEETR